VTFWMSLSEGAHPALRPSGLRHVFCLDGFHAVSLFCPVVVGLIGVRRMLVGYGMTAASFFVFASFSAHVGQMTPGL